MLWFFGQISIQHYPDEWREVKQQLIISDVSECTYLTEWKTTQCYDTLTFPWHGYMWIRFTWKIVLGSISRYFWNSVLFGDNLEIWDIYTQSNRLESKIIESYIAPGWILRWDDRNMFSGWLSFIRELKWLWIQNIILLKETDYLYYEEILEEMILQWRLERVDENSMIVLYKIL